MPHMGMWPLPIASFLEFGSENCDYVLSGGKGEETGFIEKPYIKPLGALALQFPKMTKVKQMATNPFPKEYGALKLLEAWDGLERLDSLLHNLRQRRNFFSVAPRILRVEGVHSDILAWLLDPRGWHGLSEGFALGFVSNVLAGCGLNPALPLRVDEVHREFSTGNGPIDILIRVRCGDTGVVIGVENKIDSPEGDNQLVRYAQGLSMRFPGNLVVLAFLTPTGKEARSRPTCTTNILSYRKVAELIDEAVNRVSGPADKTGLTLAMHYSAALKDHIMLESNPEIDAICRTLYDDHREAWRAIRRRLPSKRDESHAYIGSRVAEHLEKRCGGPWQSVVRRDRYACVFRPGWLDLGSYETDQIVGLTQVPELPPTYPRVHFRLVADSEETDVGERFSYRIRLKVDIAENPVCGKSLVRALKTVASLKSKLPTRTQFTLPLKSTSRLPPIIGDNPEDVPDDVVDWFATHTEELVPVVDSVFGEK
jgi:hypothetical protein